MNAFENNRFGEGVAGLFVDLSGFASNRTYENVIQVYWDILRNRGAVINLS